MRACPQVHVLIGVCCWLLLRMWDGHGSARPTSLYAAAEIQSIALKLMPPSITAYSIAVGMAISTATTAATISPNPG